MRKRLHLFIAYDEIDNSIVPYHSQSGWVEGFCENLKRAIGELNFDIPEIKGMDDFPESISERDRFMLIVIFSELSRASKNLSAQVEFYERAFMRSERMQKPGIFKILRSPVSYFDQPEFIRNLDPYEFFTADAYKDERPMSQGDGLHGDYWIQISSLAYKIVEFAYGYAKGNQSIKSKVYLSNCGDDLLSYRRIIKRDLERDGFDVLPNITYPDEPESASMLISKDMEDCILSIHLVGMYEETNRYQSFPLSGIQYHAAQKNANPEFRKLIWTFPEPEFIDEQQKSFFEIIKKENENKANADILQSSIEDLKSNIKYLIARRKRDASLSERNEPVFSGLIIYAMYDYNDKQAGQELADILRRAGFEVLVPVFDFNNKPAYNAHRQNMNLFDVCIIYCEKCNSKWLQMKLMELMKSYGYGREKPVMVKLLATREGLEKVRKIANFIVNAEVIPRENGISSLNALEILNYAEPLELGEGSAVSIVNELE